MKVFIYHRIDSSSLNDMDRELMNCHLSCLKKAAERYGHTVVGMFHDFANGLSLERPGLGSLLDAVDGRSAEGVVVKDFSRIGRDGFTAKQIQRRLRSAGCRVFVEGDFRRKGCD